MQPDTNQAHKGTVVHRHWEGDKVAGGFSELDVQWEADDSDAPVDFAVVVTLAMPGEVRVYSQVLNRVAVKPQMPVAI